MVEHTIPLRWPAQSARRIGPPKPRRRFFDPPGECSLWPKGHNSKTRGRWLRPTRPLRCHVADGRACHRSPSVSSRNGLHGALGQCIPGPRGNVRYAESCALFAEPRNLEPAGVGDEGLISALTHREVVRDPGLVLLVNEQRSHSAVVGLAATPKLFVLRFGTSRCCHRRSRVTESVAPSAVAVERKAKWSGRRDTG
jgi:hypothetical protein